MMPGGGRIKELVKKYGKVALGVHFSVSAASITGLYVAIKNNVDVETVFERVGLPNLMSKESSENAKQSAANTELMDDGFIMEQRPPSDQPSVVKKERNKTAELAASSGGALALAILLNKALFPVRVPITIALTPPVARFLARRSLIKSNF